MDLSKEFSQVKVPLDLDGLLYYQGEPVEVVRKGKRGIRVKRPNGDTFLVPYTSLTNSPGGDVHLGDPVEKVARILEQSASDTHRKFITVELIEHSDIGPYIFAKDRTGMPYAQGRYPEVGTSSDAKRLFERLQRGGMFSKVRLTSPNS